MGGTRGSAQRLGGGLLAAAIVLSACTDQSGVSTEAAVASRAALSPFADDAELLAQFRAAARAEQRPGLWPLPVGAGEVATAAESSVDAAAGGGRELSQTNTQVSGVDEADRLEAGAGWVLVLDQLPVAFAAESAASSSLPVGPPPSALQQYRLGAPAQRAADIALPAGVAWRGIYHVADSGQWLIEGTSGGALAAGLYAFVPPSRTELRALHSAGDGRATDQAAWTLSVDGHLIGSRLIDDTVYLVLEHGAVYRPGGENALSLADWLPRFAIDGGDRQPLVGSAECSRPSLDDSLLSTRVTVVVAVPVAAPQRLQARCLVGSTETVFVDRRGAWMATTAWPYVPARMGVDMIWPGDAHTDVHHFAFGDALAYRGSVRLAGHLGWTSGGQRYRFGSHGEAVSVLTTQAPGWGDREQRHHLHLLRDLEDGGLSVVAQLPNERRPAAIGKPGERVYATRSHGDRMYVVTFEVVDPLYVIDVAEPADPRIVGELEVPGFSEYLLPLSAQRLLGVGKAALAASGGDGARGAWYQGLRFSLFDVADPAAPRLIEALEYGTRGSSADALADPHALAVLADGAGWRIATPVSLYRNGDSAREPWHWGVYAGRSLLQLRVDERGLRELASTPLADDHEGRVLLREDGATWVHNAGDLHYVAADAPGIARPSEPLP